jgi:hypothetical protein
MAHTTHPTVAAVRAEMEAEGRIPATETRVGKDGNVQAGSRPKKAAASVVNVSTPTQKDYDATDAALRKLGYYLSTEKGQDLHGNAHPPYIVQTVTGHDRILLSTWASTLILLGRLMTQAQEEAAKLGSLAAAGLSTAAQARAAAYPGVGALLAQAEAKRTAMIAAAAGPAAPGVVLPPDGPEFASGAAKLGLTAQPVNAPAPVEPVEPMDAQRAADDTAVALRVEFDTILLSLSDAQLRILAAHLCFADVADRAFTAPVTDLLDGLRDVADQGDGVADLAGADATLAQLREGRKVA